MGSKEILHIMIRRPPTWVIAAPLFQMMCQTSLVNKDWWRLCWAWFIVCNKLTSGFDIFNSYNSLQDPDRCSLSLTKQLLRSKPNLLCDCLSSQTRPICFQQVFSCRFLKRCMNNNIKLCSSCNSLLVQQKAFSLFPEYISLSFGYFEKTSHPETALRS